MFKIAKRSVKELFGLLPPSKRTSKLLALISCCLPFTLLVASANAVTARLGIIRTKENAAQWEEITKRLQATGVDYCIVEASKWQNVSDFGGIRVLLMPNVDSLDRIQSNALEEWVNRGGRVIVTGPTGNLSLPTVRDQLRSLFGAYWGYTNSFPITLEAEGGQIFPTQPQATTRTLIGGTLIATGDESETAAVWVTEQRLPAVIVSNRAVYIGWRWGMKGVASPEFDVAWLEAALNRYGVSRDTNLSILKRSQVPQCNEGEPLAPSQVEGPNLPNQQQNRENRGGNF